MKNILRVFTLLYITLHLSSCATQYKIMGHCDPVANKVDVNVCEAPSLFGQ